MTVAAEKSRATREMPELPEVETVVRGLRAVRLEGTAIVSVRVRWPPLTGDVPVALFARRLRGRRIERLSRRAKYIVARLSGGWTLLIHLRMTGRLFVRARPAAAPGPHEHLAVRLDDGRELVYADTRKFGRWTLTRAPGRILDAIGPEPLSRGLTAGRFHQRLLARRRAIKPLLLDQHFLAGLGNIYVDEALWEARLHPCRGADSLGADEAARLHAAIRRVLRRGIALRGTTLGNARTNFRGATGRPGRHQQALRVFRRTGQPCPRCGDAVRRMVVGQRGTHVCERCQPPPPPPPAAAARPAIRNRRKA
jgi:formamidopyrimidine-DNA glycosylase